MPLVSDVMERDLLAVPADNALLDTAKRMAERNVGAALVLDGERIAGILTERDILRAVAAEHAAGDVVSAAGTTHRTSTEELVHLIRRLGKIPVQRDTLYRDVRIWN